MTKFDKYKDHIYYIVTYQGKVWFNCFEKEQVDECIDHYYPFLKGICTVLEVKGRDMYKYGCGDVLWEDDSDCSGTLVWAPIK